MSSILILHVSARFLVRLLKHIYFLAYELLIQYLFLLQVSLFFIFSFNCSFSARHTIVRDFRLHEKIHWFHCI